jgi:hypothetical protein
MDDEHSFLRLSRNEINDLRNKYGEPTGAILVCQYNNLFLEKEVPNFGYSIRYRAPLFGKNL